MQIKIKKIHPRAIVPKYATPGAACFDLHAVVDHVDTSANMNHVQLGRPAKFRTGLAFDIQPGFVMLVFSRSGHGFNNDARLANCVGVIDSDYTGEVMVKMTKDMAPSDMLTVMDGDRIAQAGIFPIAHVEEFILVDELKTTERGDGGFGSTGR